jgi:hypothetical protein
MNKLVVMAISIQMLLWSVNSFAGGWYYDARVQYLYSGKIGGRNAVKLVGLSPNPDGCPNTYDLVVDDANPRFKEIWSLLLSSYLTDKPVSVYLSGCGSTYNFPAITDVIFGAP